MTSIISVYRTNDDQGTYYVAELSHDCGGQTFLDVDIQHLALRILTHLMAFGIETKTQVVNVPAPAGLDLPVKMASLEQALRSPRNIKTVKDSPLAFI